jgi:hypothetical protein
VVAPAAIRFMLNDLEMETWEARVKAG